MGNILNKNKGKIFVTSGANTAASVVSLTNVLEETQTITGTSMVLSSTPIIIYGVYMNGQRLTKTTDYSIVTNTITFIITMAADSITVVYTH